MRFWINFVGITSLLFLSPQSLANSLGGWRVVDSFTLESPDHVFEGFKNIDPKCFEYGATEKYEQCQFKFSDIKPEEKPMDLFAFQPLETAISAPVRILRYKENKSRDPKRMAIVGPIDSIRFCHRYFNDNFVPRKIQKGSESWPADRASRKNTVGIGQGNDDFRFTLGLDKCIEVVTSQGSLTIDIGTSLYTELIGTNELGQTVQEANQVTEIDVIFKTTPDKNQIYLIIGGGLVSQNDLLAHLVDFQDFAHGEIGGIRQYVTELTESRTDGYVQLGIGKQIKIVKSIDTGLGNISPSIGGHVEGYVRLSEYKPIQRYGVRVALKSYIFKSVYLFTEADLALDGLGSFAYDFWGGIGYCDATGKSAWDMRVGFGQRQDEFLRRINHPMDTFIGIEISRAFMFKNAPPCSI